MSIELAVDRVDYYAVTALPSYTNATAGRVQYFAVEARDTPRLIFFDREGSGDSFETVPQTFLPSESISVSVQTSFHLRPTRGQHSCRR